MDSQSTLIVSYRGAKVEIPLVPQTRVQQVKEMVIAQAAAASTTALNKNQKTLEDSSSSAVILQPQDIKLMVKGKVLTDDNQDLYDLFLGPPTSEPSAPQQQERKVKKKIYRLMATGLSQAEATQANQTFQLQQQKMARQVRDDLSEAGLRQQQQRRRIGQQMLQKAAGKTNWKYRSPYGFGKIETLPNLPDRDKAHRILESLANDPGVLACLAKHEWQVGTLMELYPEGNVGESEVCVMGLNENKGERIQLRIRTDDLRGFRKMASIRQVLYHELAHNVHSEHNQDFFVLMRQIEQECRALDWTQGAGLSSFAVGDMEQMEEDTSYQGGTYRLGSGDHATSTGDCRQQEQHLQQHLPTSSHRELALRAALQRQTAQEVPNMEPNGACADGCTDLLLPSSPRPNNSPRRRQGGEKKDNSSRDEMDMSN